MFEDEKDNECCGKKNFKLKEFPKLPDYFNDLYDNNHEDSENFLLHIRKYNSQFQMLIFSTNQYKAKDKDEKLK